MDARSAARALAAGRVAIGLALIVAPTRGTRGWIGDLADEPGARVLTRSLGIRDLILGGIALHTVDHPEVGPRWLRTCAVADLVDLGATLAARKALPPSGVVGVGLLAAGAAAAGFALAGQVEAPAGSAPVGTDGEPPLPPPD
ncbi:MAG: hypothetical protein JHC95_22765 [Solirubrobacteraceae bacterium]|nr:hypothetical protein [Solirubrobacteraceae bacterium]